MDPDNNMASKIGQIKTNAVYHFYTWNRKNNSNEYTCKTETDAQIKQIHGNQRGKGRREGQSGVWD